MEDAEEEPRPPQIIESQDPNQVPNQDPNQNHLQIRADLLKRMRTSIRSRYAIFLTISLELFVDQDPDTEGSRMIQMPLNSITYINS